MNTIAVTKLTIDEPDKQALVKSRNTPLEGQVGPAVAVFGLPETKGRRDLRPLKVGEKVRIQDSVSRRWPREGIIVSTKDRDYEVDVTGYRRIWRNRRFLISLPEGSGVMPSSACATPEPVSILKKGPVCKSQCNTKGQAL